jgi:hypothetical protein
MEKYLKEQREKAKNFHDKANCEYDNQNYVIHLDMVAESVSKYKQVFIKPKDYLTALNAAYFHDTIEDAKLTFNDIKKVSNRRVAQVVLAVTDVHEENRLLRHLFTMGKTVKDYIAIVVKMADMRANALYSKSHGSSMYNKYLAEYEYRKPIFQMALKWYDDLLDSAVLKEFWKELDEIHNGENPEIKSDFDLLHFKEYVRTYHKTQHGADNDVIIVKDMLYGIGTSLNEEKYRFADGFKRFWDYLKTIRIQ